MENIQIRWKGTEKSPATETALTDALVILESKYAFLEPTVKAEVVAYKNDAKNPFKVRVTLFCTCKKTVRAEASAPNINTAINDCIEKADDQCRRIKVQKQNHDNKEGCKAFHK